MKHDSGFSWQRRLFSVFACLALASSLAVMAFRLSAAFQSASIPPGTAQTSGCEEESMFAVWRAAHRLPVYADSAKPPYASAYFNWFFYALYGAVVRPFRDASIPLVGRCLTAVFAVGGAILTGWMGWRFAPSIPQRLAGIAIGTYLFFGPLVGWWAVTLRPDVAGLAVETSALILFVALHRRRPMLAVGTAVALLYVAWSLKPIDLAGLCAIAIFLFFHRRWKELATLTGGSLLLWLITLTLGGPLYRAALLQTATDNRFSCMLGWANFSHAAICLAPFILFLPWWGQALSQLKPWKERSLVGDALLLCSLALPVVTVLFFAAACKTGAAPNYFFASAMLLAIGVLLGVFPLQTTRLLPATLSCALILILQVGLIAGRFGRLSLHANADELGARWAVFKHLPEPRFSSDLRLDLPWISPHSPPLVLAYNYSHDRSAGRVFVGGGLGGMIARGELASLMLPSGTRGEYDGARLDGYIRGETIAGLTVFCRSPPPSKN